MENHCEIILTEGLGQKPVPVPHCPPQIPQKINPGSNPFPRGERPATNRLSHCTAITYVSKAIGNELDDQNFDSH
jgi:hypothetical protein